MRISDVSSDVLFRSNQTPRLVIRQDRRRLGPVFSHSGADRFLIVVGPALELGRSAHIADAGRLRQFVAVVIAFPAFGAGIAAGDAIDERILVDGKLDHMVKRSEEHTSELQSLMRISYAVFCLKKTKQTILKK